MLHKSGAAAYALMAGVPALDPECMTCYREQELNRQRPWVWRACYSISPGLSLNILPIIGAALTTSGILAMATSLTNAVPLDLVIRAVFFVSGALLLAAGIYVMIKLFRAEIMEWKWVVTGRYVDLNGDMPLRAYEIIGRFREHTHEGFFRVNVIGDDPILNYVHEQTNTNVDLIVWKHLPDGSKEIVELP